MTIFTVTVANDPGTASDGTTGSVGTLSWAIAQANATTGPHQIDINVDVNLTGPLSPVFNSVTINGNGHTVDAGGVTRIFMIGVDNATLHDSRYAGSIIAQRPQVTISDLTLANGLAHGGDGSGDAGGGMGAGGALFVNSSADVTLDGVSFVDNAAKGGRGGLTYGGGGGGGGLGGDGGGLGGANGQSGGGGIFGNGHWAGGGLFGDAGLDLSAGGGGYSGDGGLGGLLFGDGADGLLSIAGLTGSGGNGLGVLFGGSGGANGGGGGGGGEDSGLTLPGGGGGFGGENGVALNGGSGGDGGFGGGGGGFDLGNGGSGGFGGGGAYQADGGFGGGGGELGDGGFGGGGGGGSGNGGFGGGGGSGGQPGFGGGTGDVGIDGGGGGGAGMGGAIFVVEGGSLTIGGTASTSGGAVAGGDSKSLLHGSAFGTGLFLQGTGTLTFDPAADETVTIADVITDQVGSGGTGNDAKSWNLIKTGDGTLVLSGENSYSGTTTVSGGVLQVTGKILSSLGVIAASDGTFRADGSASATSVTVKSGGTLGGNGGVGTVNVCGRRQRQRGRQRRHPDNRRHYLRHRRISRRGDRRDRCRAPVATTSSSSTGRVDLGGATLDGELITASHPPPAPAFTILANDGSDAVVGTFDGLPEGSVVVFDQRQFSVTYKGGDGNDVVLTALQTVIVGTGKKDVVNADTTVKGQLLPTDAADIIKGKGANDTLSGLGGDDQINGGKGKDDITGKSGNDVLNGKNGKDTIHGSKGNDSLDGGKANDKLTGGQDADAFVFSTQLGNNNVDKITDFGKGDDVIQLDSAIFTKIGPAGELANTYFTKGAKAEGSSPQIVYQKSTGDIFYAKNGDASGNQVLFAKVDKGTSLSHHDFFIV